MKQLLCYVLTLFAFTASGQQEPYIMVLGIAQDGGYPQAACKKACCAKAWKDPAKRKWVSCLALVDPAQNKAWIFDATPDFKEQWQLLKQRTNDSIQLAGFFITHAHTGHYTGLMHLGREAMGARDVPVYAMPRMKAFIEQNGPWSLLVNLHNIQLKELHNEEPVQLTGQLSIVPMQVPHRDEFSETVGFKITYRQSSMLFIPDIDKWEKWDHRITDEVTKVKYAFIDATFLNEQELQGRSIREIPHPLVTESMQLFNDPAEKNKIHFIHLNHTNMLLDAKSADAVQLEKQGFHIAVQGKTYAFH